MPEPTELTQENVDQMVEELQDSITALDGEDDEVSRRVREQFETLRDELIDAIVDEDTNNEVYKGLQRKISYWNRVATDNERERNEFRAERDQLRAELEMLRNQQADEFNFITEEFTNALDEESRERFNAKKTQRELEQLRAAINAQRAAPPQAGYAPQYDPQAIQAQLQERMKAAYEEVKGNMAELAELAGVDPKDKRLDYGKFDPNIPLPTLMKSFKESLKKVVNDEGESDVSRKRPATTTNGNGISGKGAAGHTPSDPVEKRRMAGEQLLAKIEAAQRQRARR